MVTIIKNFKYDNNYDYIKTFSTPASQKSYFNSLDIEILDETNYVKDHESFIINYNYDYLVMNGVNYILFNNGYKDIYAFITKKEYVNDECTRINFDVDVIQTFMFDFNISKSFIERKRCSLSEICEYDEGIEIGEHIIESELVCFQKEYNLFAMFNGFKDYIVDTNGTKFDEVPLIDESKPVTTIDGIVYPLMLISLNDNTSIQNFNSYLSNQPNLVGIIKMPKCGYNVATLKLPIIEMVDGKITKRKISCPQVVTSIERMDKISSSISVSKSNISDFFPYTYYALTDGECEPLILKPQYLGDGFYIKGRYALGHSPVERYYPTDYKGSRNGNIYNITNNSVMMLPVASNGGLETLIANANSIEQQKSSTFWNVLGGVAMTGAGIATGNVVGAMAGMAGLSTAISGITSIKENIARNKDIELTPNSMKSSGSTQTREAFYTNNVRLIKYTIKDKYKERLNNYVDRFGNKFNNYGIVDHKSYKGFIKYSSPDIDSKIDNIYIGIIKNILERGVYIE